MTLPSSQRGRPAGSVGEQTRARIITAAMRCVAEKGHSQATIRGIARAAGITSASLYNYFPTKAELLKATLDEFGDTVMPRLRAAAGHGGDVVDRLEAVLDELDRSMGEYPYLAAFERAMRSAGAACCRGHSEPVGSPALHDVIAEVISDVIGDAQRHGSLSAEIDAEGAVNAIYALARGLTEQAANLPSDAYRGALLSAKQLIRGTLFQAASPTRADRHR